MRGVFVAAAFVCAAASVAAQRAPEPAASTGTAHYTIVAHDGSEADVPFAHQWLDAAEQLMMRKYHVTPERYRITVYLLAAPENGLSTSNSGQNRCCAAGTDGVKTGSIYFLGPSAAIWRGTTLRSSLGLPKDGADYHAKVLMSEYIPIGHYAVQDARPSGGWTYYSAPNWFVQGLQEYDGIFHTTENNRRDTAQRLAAWAQSHRSAFTCCDNGVTIADSYNGGATFVRFLAEAFGEDVHARILGSGAPTFDEALAQQTQRTPRQLFDDFQRWLDRAP